MKIRRFRHERFGSFQQGCEVLERDHSSHPTDHQGDGWNAQSLAHGVADLRLRTERLPVYSVVKNVDRLGTPPSLPGVVIAQFVGHGSYCTGYPVHNMA